LHAASGSATAAVLALSDTPRATAVAILAAVLVSLSALDVIRLLDRRVNVLFFRSFRSFASPREARGPASSTWYTFGLLLTVAFFPRRCAVSGILVLALADPAASYVGRRWGRRAFLGATLEGTLLFAVVAFCIVAPRHGIAAAAATALVTTLAERLSRPLDDNLTLPVVGAATIALLEAVL